MDKKFVIAGIFLVLIIVSGLWLSRSGRPLNTLLLTIHKLISVAGVVFLVVTLYRLNQTAPLSPLEISLSAVTILLFIMLIVTGGLLSTGKILPGIVLRIHQVVPTLVILSTAANLYLLHGRKV